MIIGLLLPVHHRRNAKPGYDKVDRVLTLDIARTRTQWQR